MKDTLVEIIKRIVEEVDPDKVILFGSRAKNKGKELSDYDLCVLKEGIEHRRQISQRIYRRLFGVGVPVDIIVETPERFNDLKDKWFLVYSEIAKFGEVVYEK
ncbi:nucleotidyltransferase domain-containing protein [bacterium]|nr:nucleotidyltransferase domain-containing protein [bacterium]MBU1600174.1 nucleotidyltransferase domain-containing protein [bacterium]MBU2461872.1 nucleotidyltransferase domain-containing protein [bacterium]